ncbi:unnamed protein product [Protopolystoma xenopodis]|uniref:Uncharacterized protein n=1 Tax=Protopolystoma xenopodis TaxID=117903 RepID=A0A448WVW6_9PLAT|nr:unnamed protein product [Protopolystoma xenopodis]
MSVSSIKVASRAEAVTFVSGIAMGRMTAETNTTKRIAQVSKYHDIFVIKLVWAVDSSYKVNFSGHSEVYPPGPSFRETCGQGLREELHM